MACRADNIQGDAAFKPQCPGQRRQQRKQPMTTRESVLIKALRDLFKNIRLYVVISMQYMRNTFV